MQSLANNCTITSLEGVPDNDLDYAIEDIINDPDFVNFYSCCNIDK